MKVEFMCDFSGSYVDFSELLNILEELVLRNADEGIANPREN